MSAADCVMRLVHKGMQETELPRLARSMEITKDGIDIVLKDGQAVKVVVTSGVGTELPRSSEEVRERLDEYLEWEHTQGKLQGAAHGWLSALRWVLHMSEEPQEAPHTIGGNKVSTKIEEEEG